MDSKDPDVRMRKTSGERKSLKEKNVNVDPRRISNSSLCSVKRHSSSSPSVRPKTQKAKSENERTSVFDFPMWNRSRSPSVSPTRKEESPRLEFGKHSLMAKCLVKERLNKSKFRLSRSFSDSGGEENLTKTSHRRSHSDKRTKTEEHEFKRGYLSSKFQTIKRKSQSLNRRRSTDLTPPPADVENMPFHRRTLSKFSRKKQHRVTCPTQCMEEFLETRPNLKDNEKAELQERRRLENTVYLWISEAKGIPENKSYNTIVYIDGTEKPVYKTASQIKENNELLWGESTDFDITEPNVRIRLELWRSDKKKRVGVAYIGPIIPSLINNADEWIQLTTDKAEKEIPSIRVKYRLEKVDVLPLCKYKELRHIIKDEAPRICEILEPILSVKQKKEVAKTLVNVTQCEGKSAPFLNSLMLNHVKTIGDNEAVLFRGNSIGSTAMEAYMRLVGNDYLKEILWPSIKPLTEEHVQIELEATDEKKIDKNELYTHVDRIWSNIVNSTERFPVELRRVFYSLRELLEPQGRSHLTDRLISSCVFLRFLCAATLSPSLFGLTKVLPNQKSRRSLTLVTKVLQTMANFTTFQSKESYMECLNGFIKDKQHEISAFLINISKPMAFDPIEKEYKGYIDFSKQLALLHLQLFPVLVNSEHKKNLELHRLVEALKAISVQLNSNGEAQMMRQNSSPVISSHTPAGMYNPLLSREGSLPAQYRNRPYYATGTKPKHGKQHDRKSSRQSQHDTPQQEAKAPPETDESWCNEPLLDDILKQKKKNEEEQKEHEIPICSSPIDIGLKQSDVSAHYSRSTSNSSLVSAKLTNEERREQFLLSHSPASKISRRPSESDPNEKD